MQDNLDGFLSLAEELQLEGLTGSSNEEAGHQENSVAERIVKEKHCRPQKMTAKVKVQQETSPCENIAKEERSAVY